MKLIDDDEKEISEINMTPFVDIVLVILIIFMATATFMVEGKIPVNLPKTNSAEKVSEKVKKIVVAIKQTGEVLINGKPVKNLQRAIKTFKDKNTLVLIQADKNVKFQKVISVIDTFRSNGFEKYAIQTEKEK